MPPTITIDDVSASPHSSSGSTASPSSSGRKTILCSDHAETRSAEPISSGERAVLLIIVTYRRRTEEMEAKKRSSSIGAEL